MTLAPHTATIANRKFDSMKRIPEPELMTDEEQAKAYAKADFGAAHDRYAELFGRVFPDRSPEAIVLDLGCGAADVTIRFAKANPGYTFRAVDGSGAMLKYARQALRRHRIVATRIRLVAGCIPDVRLPEKDYDVILSNNLLHHVHDPQIVWRTVRKHSRRGTLIFVTDLRRPETPAEARAIVAKYSGSEPSILRRDFFNSLLAAFTVDEIQAQLARGKLGHLRVEVISDRHLMIYGRMRSQ